MNVKPAEGKLGILVVGCGAVATTFMTGVFMTRKGLAKPVGSMTQYDKIRVGKGADKKYLHYKDIVPMADLNDIVFGTWDVYPQNAYQAAMYAEVLKEKDINPVREELEQGSYLLDAPVSICVMVNFRQICRVGEGRLRHDANGFRLTGCGGKLDFTQKPETSYSLYADYFWYELGDMICIGDRDVLYYCFPQGNGDVVAKTRLAAEELYKLKRAERAAKNG